jgi:glutamate-1-semialdehyde 2,1-aminomutase
VSVGSAQEPRTAASAAAMERARRVLARGVSSAARLRTAAPTRVMAQADGAVLRDVDGNVYVDYVLGLGPVILGHRPEPVLDAVRASLERGIAFGASHEGEAVLGEQLVDVLPCAEVVTLVSTGSEAVHLALRIAREATGRSRIVKFDGHYHGWIDPLFVNAPGSAPITASPAAATHAVRGQDASSDVSVVRWHDLAELERAFAEGPPPAAVIMEPISCNFGAVLPDPAYADGVRELCTRHGALLIYDEVLTGFRMALGGAQERLGVTPDLVVCSKAVASGFPLALVAGSSAAMAPIVDGAVRPAGTCSGSPTSVAAAIATVGELSRRRAELYPHLERLGGILADGIRQAAQAAGAPLSVNQVGSVLQLFWGLDGPVRTYADACASDGAKVAELTAGLLPHGIHAAERGLLLLCAAHTDAHVEQTLAGFEVALADMSI